MTKELFQNACLTFLGIPYLWAGDDTVLGYDCSGLVQDLLKMIGLDPANDQTAQALFDHFKTRAVETGAECGSLAFYGKSVTQITHVGMFLTAETIIEAGGGGSTTTTREAAAKQNALIRLRPYTNRKDLVAIVTPQGLPWRGDKRVNVLKA